MKEVEVKAKVNAVEELKNNLERMGCKFSPEVKQKDSIFLKNNLRFEEVESGTNILRIREEDGKTILTLKQPRENELDCIEEETIVENPEATMGILKLLGFNLAVKVIKTRIKTNFGQYEICIDKVENLGNFIEIQKIIKIEENSLEVQKELFAFLKTLDIKEADRVCKGYDTLIYEKQKLSV